MKEVLISLPCSNEDWQSISDYQRLFGRQYFSPSRISIPIRSSSSGCKYTLGSLALENVITITPREAQRTIQSDSDRPSNKIR